MTSSTISVNFNDTEQKTVFTATEKCILKLSVERNMSVNNQATFKLNNTVIGLYGSYQGAFELRNRSLANILSFAGMQSNNEVLPTALILYLEEGDTVYATRTTNNAFTATFYSTVFTF